MKVYLEKEEATLYTVGHVHWNNRSIRHFVFESGIIPIHIIQYEVDGGELQTVYAGTDEAKATNKFNTICSKIIRGKL